MALPLLGARGGYNPDGWLITFVDLLALILAFFVMLFSMNAIQEEEWKPVVASFNKQFHGERPAVVEKPQVFKKSYMTERPLGQDLDYLYKVIESKLARDPIFDRAKLSVAEDRIVLSLPGDLIFTSGSARLKKGVGQTLFRLAGVIGQFDNTVAIEGHTDPSPVRSGRFVTNWELSMARAISVANALEEAGFDQPLPVMGFGSSRYGYRNSSAPDRQRRAAARRVDVVIHKHRWDSKS